MSDYYSYMGFEIPVDLLNMTGGGVDSFDEISKGHINYLNENIGIKKTDKILEVGCGIGRDAIPLTKILNSKGSYLGIDIIGRSINWCQENITSKHKNFNFIHFDVKDQLHNPNGLKKQKNINIPLSNNSVDLIILWSVVTHLFEKDIIHYFKEFNRVLKPNGIVMATCFLVDDKILEIIKTVNLTPFDLRFEHSYGRGCFINNKEVPAGAVAFTRDKILHMLDKADLELDRPICTGSWWGNLKGNGFGQDVLFLRKKISKKHSLVKAFKNFFKS
jgi:SAM-dependent methyltransferase